MASKVLSVIITGDVKSAVASFGQLDAAAGTTGDSIAGRFAKVGLLVGAAFAAAAVGAGIALFQIGKDFDAAYDKIRIGTGATGDTLAGLKDDFKDVVTSVPTDFGSAATAIADLNTRLGLTGPLLQERSAQFLELSRITGTDLGENIESITRLFGDWSVAVDQQGGTMDKLFRVSQATGIGVSDLSRLMVQFGSPLRQMGIDFDTAAAMFARFEKEGVNIETLLPGMRFALKTFAQDGRAPAEALKETIARIKELGPSAEATQLAFDTFGVRAGSDMAAAIQEGRFELDSLIDTMNNGSDTILGVGEETQDFSQKWQIFKNRVLVGLEPLAIKVFNALGVAMDRLPGIISSIRTRSQPVVDWLRNAWPEVQHAVEVAVAFIMEKVWPRLVEGFNYVKGQVENLVAAFSERWEKIKEAARNVAAYLAIVWGPALILIRNVWDHIGDIIRAAWNYIRGVVKAGIDAIRGIIDIVLGLLTLDFDQAWTGIKTLVGAAWDGIKNTINLALESVKIGISIALATIGDLWSIAWDGIKNAAGAAWEGIKSLVSAGIEEVVNFVAGLPGRIAGFWLSMAGAGVQLAGALLGGLKDGIIGAAGIAGEIASGIVGVMKGAWNSFARTANDIIPDKIPVPFPFPDIDLPNDPIPTLHTGGIFHAGPQGEGLALLADGEGVFTSEQMANLAPVGAGGNTYRIIVNVPPTVDRAEVGRELVRAIAAYEKRGGR